MAVLRGLWQFTRGHFTETDVDKKRGYGGVDAYHNVSE
jgi:hypothetical protein